MADSIKTNEDEMLLVLYNKIIHEETSPLFAQLSTQHHIFIP